MAATATALLRPPSSSPAPPPHGTNLSSTIHHLDLAPSRNHEQHLSLVRALSDVKRACDAHPCVDIVTGIGRRLLPVASTGEEGVPVVGTVDLEGEVERFLDSLEIPYFTSPSQPGLISIRRSSRPAPLTHIDLAGVPLPAAKEAVWRALARFPRVDVLTGIGRRHVFGHTPPCTPGAEGEEKGHLREEIKGWLQRNGIEESTDEVNPGLVKVRRRDDAEPLPERWTVD